MFIVYGECEHAATETLKWHTLYAPEFTWNTDVLHPDHFIRMYFNFSMTTAFCAPFQILSSKIPYFNNPILPVGTC